MVNASFLGQQTGSICMLRMSILFMELAPFLLILLLNSSTSTTIEMVLLLNILCTSYLTLACCTLNQRHILRFLAMLYTRFRNFSGFGSIIIRKYRSKSLHLSLPTRSSLFRRTFVSKPHSSVCSCT